MLEQIFQKPYLILIVMVLLAWPYSKAVADADGAAKVANTGTTEGEKKDEEADDEKTKELKEKLKAAEQARDMAQMQAIQMQMMAMQQQKQQQQKQQQGGGQGGSPSSSSSASTPSAATALGKIKDQTPPVLQLPARPEEKMDWSSLGTKLKVNADPADKKTVEAAVDLTAILKVNADIMNSISSDNVPKPAVGQLALEEPKGASIPGAVRGVTSQQRLLSNAEMPRGVSAGKISAKSTVSPPRAIASIPNRMIFSGGASATPFDNQGGNGPVSGHSGF